uniref:Uncharacterized protein n=1 Tax=Oryza nivara TaxID=4536 RepID=A0A0E0GL45_ORYNI
MPGRPVAPKDCLRPQPPVAVLSSLALVAPASLLAHNAELEGKWWFRRSRTAIVIEQPKPKAPVYQLTEGTNTLFQDKPHDMLPKTWSCQGQILTPGKKLGQLRPSNAGKDGKEWLLLEELQGQIARFGTLMTE